MSFPNSFPRSIANKNVKNHNKHAVLDLIRFTPGGISRVELAKKLELTRAAVTSIVNDLMGSGIIREAERRSSSSGRPPIMLEINSERGIVAGVDMGATHLTIIIANFSGQLLAEKEIPLNISDGPELCIEKADAILKEVLKSINSEISELSAIGVGVPGPVVAEAGMVVAPPIMPGWDQFPIRDTLQKRWNCPVSLSNDAELGALGEWASGAGRGELNLAFIKVGTGVGAGILINGQIYRGASGSAGEIGHITVDENGPLCKCGNRGCLEAIASGTAIAQQAQQAAKNGKRTELAKIRPLESITTQDVMELARKGDLISQQILIRAGGQLGIALAGLVNLFNPNMIVVGGSVPYIGDLFLEPVRDAVKKRSMRAAAKVVKITTALLGKRSVSMGAITQALTLSLHLIADDKTGQKTQNYSKYISARL